MELTASSPNRRLEMQHNLIDLTDEDLLARITSPYWNIREHQEAIQEQVERRFRRLNNGFEMQGEILIDADVYS
jgi:hypothetical protein